jgi:hypothetical protein
MRLKLLFLVAMSMFLSACANRSSFMIRASDGAAIKETTIGSLNWAKSPPVLDIKKLGTVFDSPANRQKLSQQVEYLSVSKAYASEKARIRSVVFDQSTGQIWYRFENCRYLVFSISDSTKSRTPNAVDDSPTFAGYQIVESGVMAPCKNL